MTWLLATLCLALIWLSGSVAIALLMPWRVLDRSDRRLAWGFVAGWPVMVAWMAIEVPRDFRKRGR